MGPGRESAPPFAQESNLLSCPRRVKDFLEKVSYSRPRAPLRGPLADSVPPFRGAPSSEGLAIIPRIGGIASVFRDFFRLVGNRFE